MVKAEDHIALAYAIANSFTAGNDYHTCRDIEAAALEGLTEAARSFRPQRGWRFSTHASFRVRGAIVDYFRTKNGRGKVRPASVDLEGVSPMRFRTEDPEPKPERADVEPYLARLAEKERKIVVRYFLKGEQMAEIGRSVGVSESRISQVIGQALRTMRGTG